MCNSKVTPQHISFWSLLTNQRAIMAGVSAIVALTFMFFIDTIYSNYLISIGVSINYAGYAFTLGFAAYSLSSIFVGYLCRHFHIIHMTSVAFPLLFVSLLMLGPSQILNFPSSPYLSIAGNTLIQIPMTLIFVPLISEFIEALKEKEGLSVETEQMNDIASGAYNLCHSGGSIIAPIIGGLLNSLYGFRTTCDIMAFSSLFFTIVYFIVSAILRLVNIRKERRNRVAPIMFEHFDAVYKASVLTTATVNDNFMTTAEDGPPKIVVFDFYNAQ